MGALRSVEVVDQAVAAAAQAAEQGGLTIRQLDEVEQIENAVALFRAIWGPEERDIVGVATMRALSHSGNYVFGAYLGAELVGAITGFVGWHEGALQLHSHVLGVSPEAQGANVGFTLKEHQRGWALVKGIKKVTWTYDPLVSRNAYFNLAKLGASVTTYYPSFYGLMNDEINGHDESDRVLIEWDLESPRAIDASTGISVALDADGLRDAGAEIALAVGDDETPTQTPVSSDSVLVAIPRDIVQVRHKDPALAHEWRLALRDVLGSALHDGYVTVGMTRAGYYVLERTR